MTDAQERLTGYLRTAHCRSAALVTAALVTAALVTAALVLWLFTSAAHVHAAGEPDAPDERISACQTCLSLPSSAAPPGPLVLLVPPPVAGNAIAAPAIPSPRFVAPSSYLSRAPPAR